MKGRPTIDVSGLPTFGFGPRDALWWGVVGMIAIEATVFALALVTYFYLRGGAVEWPPPGAAMPHLLGTVNMVVLLASIYPMHRANKAALDAALK
ncbi:MAG: cytochrome C oxidase subunit III, partial [Thermoanaerobaculia bacterium]